MRTRLLLFSLALVALLIAACGDDDPVAPKTVVTVPFNTSQMPLTVPNTTSGYGNLGTGPGGNLLVPGMNGELYMISKTDGTIGLFADGIGAAQGGPFNLMCCAYDAAAGRIYVAAELSNPSQIWYVETSDSSVHLLANLGDNGYITQLLMVPAGFGAYANQLLVCSYYGSGAGIVAVNPNTPGAPVTIAAQKCNAAAFGPDGTLYITDPDNNRVATVSAAGVVADYLIGVTALEGIVVNQDDNRMYIARVGMSGDVDSLYSVTMPGKVVTSLPFGPDLDNGWYPTGLILDNAGKILFSSGETSQIIDFFDL